MKTIMYDATLLLNAAQKNSGRSGIYFVVYNILHILNKNKQVDLTLYINNGQYRFLKSVIKRNIPEFKNLKIWTPTPKNIFVDIIEFFSSLKTHTKEKNHKILANFLHIFNLIIKILFFIPRTLIALKKNEAKCDVFLSPVYKIPDVINKNKKIQKYTIIYDTIPFLFPEYYGFKDKTLNTFWLKELVDFMGTNNTDKYFAISEHTKKDFLKLIPSLKQEQITVMPLACSENFHPCTKEQTIAALKKYNLPTDKKYVFSLCSLEPRKNLIRAVKTFVDFIKKNKIDDMVFIMGGGQWACFIEKLESEIKDLGKYRDKILKAGYIDDEDLAPLYSGAEFFVYTSQYEGFGLPPLEAMSCGTPVVTSNNSSLPEVVGNAGIMIDFDSDEQHIAAYEKYYFDEKYRNKMAKAGLKRSKEFSWEKTVDLMLKEMLKNE